MPPCVKTRRVLLPFEVDVKYILIVPLAPQLKTDLCPSGFDGCELAGRLATRQFLEAFLAM